MVKHSHSPSSMFKFSTGLFVWKNRIKKNGSVSLLLKVQISIPGNIDRDYFPLYIEWPLDFIDFDRSILLDRYKGDPDTNDYNMIIMTERSKTNEIAKLYRLSGRHLSTETLKRELFYFDTTKSVIGYFKKRRRELLKMKVVSEQTWKNYGSTISALEEYRPFLRWDQINLKFMYEFRAWLKKRKKSNGNLISHNTIWTRIKDLKAFFGIAKDEIQVYVPQDVIDFPNSYVESESTYLNKEEIIRLIQQMDADVLNPTQFNVLKAFLFCCFSGIRISDLYNSKYS